MRDKRFAAAVTLGAVAGMRTMTAPAAVSMRLQGRFWSWRRNRAETFLRKRMVHRALLVAAAAELVGDKLPFAPDRIRILPLAARAASGALAGWALARDRDAAVRYAAAGAVTAVAVAWAAWGVRRLVATRSRIPDPVIGIVEDAIAINAARSVRYP
ncbi:MAG TPA: DUF4126 family protein [Thermoanaerobaculia bacterium]